MKRLLACAAVVFFAACGGDSNPETLSIEEVAPRLIEGGLADRTLVDEARATLADPARWFSATGLVLARGRKPSARA